MASKTATDIDTATHTQPIYIETHSQLQYNELPDRHMHTHSEGI